MLRERAHLPAVVGHNYHDGVATADAVFADLVTSVTSVTNPSLTTLSHSAVKKSSRTFSPCSQRRPRRRGRLPAPPAGRPSGAGPRVPGGAQLSCFHSAAATTCKAALPPPAEPERGAVGRRAFGCGCFLAPALRKERTCQLSWGTAAAAWHSALCYRSRGGGLRGAPTSAGAGFTQAWVTHTPAPLGGMQYAGGDAAPATTCGTSTRRP
jgi:hypothetical protein